MRPDGSIGNLQLASIIDVVYHLTSMGVEVVAQRPAQGRYPELAEWKLTTTGAAMESSESSPSASAAAHDLLQWFAGERGHCTWTVLAPSVLSPDGVERPTLGKAIAQELAAAAAVVAYDHCGRCSPEPSASSVDAEASFEQLVAGVSVRCGTKEDDEDLSPAACSACYDMEQMSANRHAQTKSIGHECVEDPLHRREAKHTIAEGLVADANSAVAATQGSSGGDVEDKSSCIGMFSGKAAGTAGGNGVHGSVRAQDEQTMPGDCCSSLAQGDCRRCFFHCDWPTLAASAVARHGHVSTPLGEATLFEMSLEKTGVDGLLLAWAPHPRSPDPELYLRLVEPS
jgi:hypothetical protein